MKTITYILIMNNLDLRTVFQMTCQRKQATIIIYEYLKSYAKLSSSTAHSVHLSHTTENTCLKKDDNVTKNNN